MPRPATTFSALAAGHHIQRLLFEAEGPEAARENFKDTSGWTSIWKMSMTDGNDRWPSMKWRVVRAREVVPDHAPLITTSPENPSQRLPYLIVAMSMMMVLVSWILYRTLAS
ncbi:unnamed protein product, partial [Mesorhabditis spiculigera]